METQLKLTLQNNKLFQNIDINQLNLNDIQGNLITVKEGQIIFKEGESASDLFLIVSGKVNVLKEKIVGKPKSFVFKKGTFFGEEDLSENTNRTSTAVALCDSYLLKFSKYEFENLKNQSQQITENILQNSKIWELNQYENASHNIGNKMPGDNFDKKNIEENISSDVSGILEEETKEQLNETDLEMSEDITEDNIVEDNLLKENQLKEDGNVGSSVENEPATENSQNNREVETIGTPEEQINQNIEDESGNFEGNEINGNLKTEIEEEKSMPLESLNENQAELNKEETKSSRETVAHINELLQKERISAFNKMVRFLNQDIKKPVLVSKGYAEHLYAKGLPPEFTQILDMQVKQLNDVADNIQITSQYSEETIILRTIRSNINNILNEFIDRADSLLTMDNCKIIKKFDDDIDVKIDPKVFFQGFKHLIKNAVEAMPEGGNITIETLKKGDEIEISFKDEGAGVPEDISDLIFEPFISNKKDNAGLGLFVVKKIIENHNGTIRFESTMNEGSNFIITLPIPL